MKKTMKITMSLIIMMMVLGGLAGCGKSEEEKAMDEIAEHLRDEAAKDGVDLDNMVSEEAEKYNSELEAGNKAIANENEFKESLKNNEMVPLKEQYEIYLNATDSATAKKAAKEFNKAYDEYLKAAIGEYIVDEYSASELLRQNDIRVTKITDSEIQTRVNYLDNCYGQSYNKIQLFKDNNKNISILMYNETDDQIVSDVVLVFPDGKALTPNLSNITEPIQSISFVVNNNSLIITNYSWAYEFTPENVSGASIGNADGSPVFPEGDYSYSTELWENTIEEFNRVTE
ncbi:hypothetical protein [Thomasclavelia cocleata]|uniref:hypothetical protein n=1 Tax=Thomasclavelia cocleata TaxID=69824 RepID=UPI00256EDF1E|nr:hypothetical protein [Thomasclavelia cocleata]